MGACFPRKSERSPCPDDNLHRASLAAFWLPPVSFGPMNGEGEPPPPPTWRLEDTGVPQWPSDVFSPARQDAFDANSARRGVPRAPQRLVDVTPMSAATTAASLQSLAGWTPQRRSRLQADTVYEDCAASPSLSVSSVCSPVATCPPSPVGSQNGGQNGGSLSSRRHGTQCRDSVSSTGAAPPTVLRDLANASFDSPLFVGGLRDSARRASDDPSMLQKHLPVKRNLDVEFGKEAEDNLAAFVSPKIQRNNFVNVEEIKSLDPRTSAPCCEGRLASPGLMASGVSASHPLVMEQLQPHLGVSPHFSGRVHNVQRG